MSVRLRQSFRSIQQVFRAQRALTVCLCPCWKALFGKSARISGSSLELVRPVAGIRACHQLLVRSPVQDVKIRLLKLWSVRVRKSNVVLDLAVMSRCPIEYFRHKAYTTRTRICQEAIGPLTWYTLFSMEYPAINYSKGTWKSMSTL